MPRVAHWVMCAAASLASPAQADAEVRVYAAGSLRAALTEVAQAFERAEPSARVVFTFGASGLLKNRLAAGERADVFASANMEHPQSLASAGLAGLVQRFARNAMCALVAPTVDVTPDTLVDRMLDPATKLGTSTPKADPSGDYAWMVFERIEAAGTPRRFPAACRQGAAAHRRSQFAASACRRNVYAELVAQGRADVFITYCTNATAARVEQPNLREVAVPRRST